MEKIPSQDHQDCKQTPKSVKTTKKDIHLKKLSTIMTNFPIQNCKTFVMGISGGDCSGKKELIQYMFDKDKDDSWFLKDTKEPVTIVHQQYFVKSYDGAKYTSEGTDWPLYYKETVNLLIGNQITVKYKKYSSDQAIREVKLKPTKLLVLEGMHIFMKPDITANLSSLINLKVFIDSDSDVRLSRRVYQDTQEKNMLLEESVSNYLQFIKPSYQREIEPVKQSSDIIIPHFGGGFNDHKRENRHKYSSNIRVACALLLTQTKQEMKKYEQEIQDDEQIKQK